MELKDKLSSLTGEVFIEVRDKDGNLIEKIHQKNIVTNGGRDAIVRLIAEGTSGKRVTKIGFGIGTAAAQLTDTSMTSAFVKSVGSRTYPASGQVEIEWTLGLGEANGMAITEIGLYCQDDTLFSRLVRETPINKTSDISLSSRYVLNY